MTREWGEAWRRGWWMLFFALVALVELRIAFRGVMAGDPYSAGDWLINYSGGFVRRGFPGHLILWLAGWLHGHLLGLVFALQAVCLLVYLGFACRLAMRGRGFVVAAMVLSPAAVTFELLNPAEGVRKEMLLFAVLAVLLGAGFVERMRTVYLGLLLTFVCVVLVLSHESLAVYLPYLFAAVWVRRRDLPEAARIFSAPVVGVLAAGAAVLRHPGDARTAEAICRSVGGVFAGFDAGICGGSIAWLAVSLPEAHRRTMELAGTYHFAAIYAFLGALALGPALWLARRSPVILTCAAVAGLGSLALFWSGVDWGRWIHLHAVCLMLLLLAVPAPEEPRSRIWGAAVAVYATCWLLPVTIMSAAWPQFGVLGAIVHGLFRSSTN